MTCPRDCQPGAAYIDAIEKHNNFTSYTYDALSHSWGYGVKFTHTFGFIVCETTTQVLFDEIKKRFTTLALASGDSGL